MTNNTGLYQKIVYGLFVFINIGIGMVTYAPFYMFYKPDYICFDDKDIPFSCSKELACQPGQKFILDSSKDFIFYNKNKF